MQWEASEVGRYRTTPTYEQPLTSRENTTSVYWRWFQDIELGAPPSSELAVTAHASPFIYSAPFRGNLVVSGGAVTSIQYSRSGTFYNTGLTSGMFHVSQNDQLKIVFTAIPNLVFAPT